MRVIRNAKRRLISCLSKNKSSELNLTADILRGVYPSASFPSRLSCVERWTMAILVLLRWIFIDKWIPERFKECQWVKNHHISHADVTDLFVILKFILLFILLVVSPALSNIGVLKWIVSLLIVYLLGGMLNYQLCIIFVDRLKSDWKLISPNRSIILLFVNYFRTIFGFAALYILTRSIGNSDCANPITCQAEAIYFSLLVITGLGSNDSRPIQWSGKALISLEAIIGLILFVLVLTMFMDIAAQTYQRSKT